MTKTFFEQANDLARKLSVNDLIEAKIELNFWSYVQEDRELVLKSVAESFPKLPISQEVLEDLLKLSNFLEEMLGVLFSGEEKNFKFETIAYEIGRLLRIFLSGVEGGHGDGFVWKNEPLYQVGRAFAEKLKQQKNQTK